MEKAENITEQMAKILAMEDGDEPSKEQLKALAELLNTKIENDAKPSNEEIEKEQLPTKEQMANIKRIAKDKAKANKAKEPFVAILDLDIDYENLESGSFELDFNDIFVAKLLKAGYNGDDDYEIVDQWFTDVCKNVAMEVYENSDEVNSLHPNDRSKQNKKIDKDRREFR